VKNRKKWVKGMENCQYFVTKSGKSDALSATVENQRDYKIGLEDF